jgi:hypothetical protein
LIEHNQHATILSGAPSNSRSSASQSRAAQQLAAVGVDLAGRQPRRVPAEEQLERARVAQLV